MPADELLTSKELAAALKRHPSYVYAMHARGFKTISGLTTLRQAMAYLKRNPHPRGRKNGRHNGSHQTVPDHS